MKNNLKLMVSVFVMTFAFLCSCSEPQLPTHERIANEVTLEVSKKLISEHKGLRLAGTGGGMIDDVKCMMIAFDYRCESINMDFGRKLLVQCVETLLKTINSSEKIRPYLHNYPFLPNNVEVVIYFYRVDGSKFPPETAFIFSETNGKVRYRNTDPLSGKLHLICEESYEETLRIAKGP